MNNKDAAIVLKNLAFMLEDGTKYMNELTKRNFREAYELAIKALEEKGE